MEINLNIFCPYCQQKGIEENLVLTEEHDCDPYLYCYLCGSISYVSEQQIEQLEDESRATETRSIRG